MQYIEFNTLFFLRKELISLNVKGLKINHIIIGSYDFGSCMLFTAVWNIFVTSYFVLQFIM